MDGSTDDKGDSQSSSSKWETGSIATGQTGSIRSATAKKSSSAREAVSCDVDIDGLPCESDEAAASSGKGTEVRRSRAEVFNEDLDPS
jgi:hypothetical protein